jgi:hypothetical protein
MKRIRHGYFAVHREDANQHKKESMFANFRPKQKNQILNHLPTDEQMGEKIVSRNCPFKA